MARKYDTRDKDRLGVTMVTDKPADDDVNEMLRISSGPELTRKLQARAARALTDIVGPARKAFIFDLGKTV